jgi:microcystin-dependent protein
MTDPFLGEVRLFCGNFAPRGWAYCDGQLMPISQNTALFSLLGTTYGGDGRVTFALPDLRGSVPLQQGQGPGLSQRFLGEQGGEQTVTLGQSEMPAHTHSVQAVAGAGSSNSPAGGLFAQAHSGRVPDRIYATGVAPDVSMSPQAIGVSGGSQPHNNMPPYLCVSFIIALQGIFPPRP